MKAVAGDRLVVRPLTASPRDAEILEVHGSDGEPPYLVRWSDDGHEGLVFPGSDASVEHFDHDAVATADRSPRSVASAPEGDEGEHHD
jgi:hypothetical protein